MVWLHHVICSGQQTIFSIRSSLMLLHAKTTIRRHQLPTVLFKGLKPEKGICIFIGISLFEYSYFCLQPKSSSLIQESLKKMDKHKLIKINSLNVLNTCNTANNILMLPDALHNSSITKRNYLETVLPVST